MRSLRIRPVNHRFSRSCHLFPVGVIANPPNDVSRSVLSIFPAISFIALSTSSKGTTLRISASDISAADKATVAEMAFLLIHGHSTTPAI